MSSRGKLELHVTNELLKKKRPNSSNEHEVLEDILEANKTEIEAWLYAMLFVTIIPALGDRINFKVEQDKREIAVPKKNVTQQETGENEQKIVEQEVQIGEQIQQEEILGYKLTIEPCFDARKTYFSCIYWAPGKQYDELKKVLEDIFKAVAGWVKNECKLSVEENEIQTLALDMAGELLEEMGISSQEKIEFGSQNVEILYDVGQSIGAATTMGTTDKETAYQALAAKYQAIDAKLREIDQYYRDEIELTTKFEVDFKKAIQTKLLLGDKSLSEPLQERFRDYLGQLLVEPTRVKLAK